MTTDKVEIPDLREEFAAPDYSLLTDDGREQFSGVCQVIPVKLRQKPSLHDQIKKIILDMREREIRGFESFQDADDFEVSDDPDQFNSPYEIDFDHIGQNLDGHNSQEEAVASDPASDPSVASQKSVNSSAKVDAEAKSDPGRADSVETSA